MNRRLYLLVVAVLACGILVAGCGGDDDNGSSGSSGSSGSNDSSDSIIDSCKQSVSAAQGLSSAAKKDLDDRCEKAGSDADAARKASQDVCVGIVKDTIPSGSTQDLAVDACKQTSQ